MGFKQFAKLAQQLVFIIPVKRFDPELLAFKESCRNADDLTEFCIDAGLG